MKLHGIGPSGAAQLLVDVADIARFPDRGHFASWNGTAPIDASSGDQVRHRLSRLGNRQINRTLHIMATVHAHSEKERAAATFKKTFGYHPIGVWCDNSQKVLAAILRPGNAGSNTTADHIAVLTAAIAQVPPGHRRKLLIRADGPGASHGLLEWLIALNLAA